MCGINGFNWNDSSLILEMNKCTKNRGPDDEGIYTDNVISLGHNRLSILDLSPKGHQPMSNTNDTISIIYNGEIYNFNEIKKDLEAKGHFFKSTSDTEVIIHAYEEFGLECMNKFNGMWAFCLYDKKLNQIILCRDRFGIKPLYYYIKDGKIIFSSLISAILIHPVEKEPDNSVIMEYLAYSLVNHDSRTFFKNINSLEPGSFLIFDLKSKTHSIKKWYNLKIRENGSEAHIKELFLKSVNLRTVSDVPVGSCLSGGIDSSAIVCALSNYLKKPFFTYSLIFPHKKMDESRYIEEIGKNCPLTQKYTTLNEDAFLDDLDDFIRTQEEPVPGLSIYGQYCVMKLAHNNKSKVLLDGQGGDEIFAGYTYYFAYYFFELLQKGKLFKLFKELIGYCSCHKSTYGIQFFVFLLFPEKLKLKIVRKFFINWVDNNYFDKYSKNRFDPRWKRMTLDEGLRLTLETTAIPHLLRYEDKNSMRWSVETRLPFLDFNLVETALGFPSGSKISNGRTKVIFREAVQDLLPELIKQRKDKIGFETPTDEFIRSPNIRKLCNEIINSQSFKNRPYWKWDEIQKLYQAHMEGKKNIGDTIFKWVTLELWMRIYFEETSV